MRIQTSLFSIFCHNDKERGSGVLPEFATGNKWGNDGVGKLARFDASSINIIDASACGAFTAIRLNKRVAQLESLSIRKGDAFSYDARKFFSLALA